VAGRHVIHGAGWVAGCVVGPVALHAVLGRPWLGVGIGLAMLATLWLLLWLPRSAHDQFEAGRYQRAARRYRLVVAFSFSATRERAGLLSRAGCLLALGDHERAAPLLDALATADLDVAERAVWLNNRACLGLDRGTDPTTALALAEEAVALRPDVAAIQHTRARALLVLDRVDEAISVLDAMRTGGELAPTLEADRCRELAIAWDRKGHAEYASDYRDRARVVARI
jgi:tetratricopeptide (TPR) repeat protein